MYAELERMRKEHEDIKESRLVDQKRIIAVERRIQIIDTAFDDLKKVDREHEAQYEMTQLSLEEYDNEDICSKMNRYCFCCCFCCED